MVDEVWWPDIWREHRLFPLFKRNLYFMPQNYRGIHITSILSKVAERLIAHTFGKFLQAHGYGQNQWAYRQGRGAKDLLLFITTSWLLACFTGYKVGAYMSDISGAFDKVFANVLLAKLRQVGLGDKICDFFSIFDAASCACCRRR